MKIYTRTGDKGTTSLFTGKRVSKASIRIEAIGTVDELNSNIGLIRSGIDKKFIDINKQLALIQNDLFMVGSSLARPDGVLIGEFKLSEDEIEKSIDEMTKPLPILRNFILPTGNTTSSQFHVARSVGRRAERRVVELSKREKINPLVLSYLNRLSDYFFTCARYINYKTKTNETEWKK